MIYVYNSLISFPNDYDSLSFIHIHYFLSLFFHYISSFISAEVRCGALTIARCMDSSESRAPSDPLSSRSAERQAEEGPRISVTVVARTAESRDVMGA